uniref:cell death protein 3-like isoform X2 n=1 Tax=Ciona intestinalis TaxID=7719 RepID=UPI000EF48D9D|nr:cell death protein 3-like isoform X2 [Ciona intestinalis]|eukprot:XP_026690729.1 cell death protein 3-like isoform X2 [Ciona intestinalis]
MPIQGNGGLGENDQIYAILGKFNHKEFLKFAQLEQGLGLSNKIIDGIESDCANKGVEEQQFQMVRKWKMRNGSKATVEVLKSKANRYLGTTYITPEEASATPTQPSPIGQQTNNPDTPFVILLRRVSSQLDENNLRMLRNNYAYCTGARNFRTALELFQYLEENNLWGCGTEEEKVEILVRKMRQLGRHDVVEIIQNFQLHANQQQDVTLTHEIVRELAERSNSSTPFVENVDATYVSVPRTESPVPASISSSYLGNMALGDQSDPISEDICSFQGNNVQVLESDDMSYVTHFSKVGVYTVRSKEPKGHVLILNNYEGFAWGPDHDRKGAKRDGELMKQLWEGFQCKVIVKENRTAGAMFKFLNDFSRSSFHQSCDFCAVVIMSHGGLVDNRDVFYGVDCRTIAANDVLALFKNTHSKYLIGRPKLIFFQCCRGGSSSRGVPFVDAADAVNRLLPPSDQTDGIDKTTLPHMSDILVAYSTLEGDMSFRNEATGSWFINAIATVFSKKARTEHVVDMLTEVGRGVSHRAANTPDNMATHRCKEMSEYKSTLRNKLYLFPGFPKAEEEDNSLFM